MTDIDGEVFQHVEYFPFGETWVEEHSNRQRTPYLFTGKELDEDTQLYYFGARYYDPRTSVWQSPDPILARYLKGSPNSGVENPKNLNLYSSTWNNPVKYTDPDGNALQLCAIPTGPMQACAAAAVGAVEALAVGGGIALAMLGIQSAVNSEPAPTGFASLPQSAAALNVPSRTMGLTGDYTASEIAVFRSMHGDMKDRMIGAGLLSITAANNQKLILIPEAIIPHVAAVDEDGIRNAGSVLTWNSSRSNNRANRRDALRGLGSAGVGMSWEEYPFASTLEGGNSAGLTVGPVPIYENWVQGGLISGACAIQLCKQGDRIHVVIVPRSVYDPSSE